MLIYGADTTGSAHNTNRTDHFYCIGKVETQRITEWKNNICRTRLY